LAVDILAPIKVCEKQESLLWKLWT
jgi:hypothetical protein